MGHWQEPLSPVNKVRLLHGTWESFPAEIRLMIWEEYMHNKPRGWSACACVSKEWQAYFEAHNFRHLELTESCLDEFTELEEPRRHHIRHIFLNIELTPEDCTRGLLQDAPETTVPVEPWNVNVTCRAEAFPKLLRILSRWNDPGASLTLELNVWHSSDRGQWFSHLYTGSCPDDVVDQRVRMESMWYNGHHDFDIEGFDRRPSFEAIVAFFSSLLFTLPGSFPLVPAVTGLVIRRQMRRRIPPELLGRVLSKLPRLESIKHEGWRDVIPLGYDASADMSTLICDELPSQVKTVTIFEDFDERLWRRVRSKPRHGYLAASPGPNPNLAKSFAVRSQTLEHLSVSYMIDARHFFDACKTSHTWQRLRSLKLSSPILTQWADKWQIEAMLLRAAAAATNMPQLEDLAIWNSKAGEAAAFYFQRNIKEHRATIIWRGTWSFAFSKEVVAAWRKAATDSCLLSSKHRIIKHPVRSHGTGIAHLHLGPRVIDPRSLAQIRKEARAEGSMPAPHTMWNLPPITSNPFATNFHFV